MPEQDKEIEDIEFENKVENEAESEQSEKSMNDENMNNEKINDKKKENNMQKEEFKEKNDIIDKEDKERKKDVEIKEDVETREDISTEENSVEEKSEEKKEISKEKKENKEKGNHENKKKTFEKNTLKKNIISNKHKGTIKKYKKKNRSLITFAYIVALIFIGLIIILGIRYLMASKAMSIEELHKQNIKGKFTDRNYFYNGYSFVNYDNLWWTQIQSKDKTLYDIPFKHSPKELENYIIEPGLPLVLLKNKKLIYMSINKTENISDSKMGIAALELARITGKRYNMFNIDTIGAYTTFTEPIVPVITCANSSNTTAVVIYTVGQMNRAYSDNNCIIIEGTSEDEVIKVADRFAYEILGIFKK